LRFSPSVPRIRTRRSQPACYADRGIAGPSRLRDGILYGLTALAGASGPNPGPRAPPQDMLGLPSQHGRRPCPAIPKRPDQDFRTPNKGRLEKFCRGNGAAQPRDPVSVSDILTRLQQVKTQITPGPKSSVGPEWAEASAEANGPGGSQDRAANPPQPRMGTGAVARFDASAAATRPDESSGRPSVFRHLSQGTGRREPFSLSRRKMRHEVPGA
jgi:hypothetical protein